MIPVRVIAAVAALAVVAGCAGGGGVIEEIRTIEPTGSPFTRALTEEYRQIALREAEDRHDWRSAQFFARKGLRAARGEPVEPEWLPAWDLPADQLEALDPARKRLISLMVRGARSKAPEQAAAAQGRFDCWVEQASEPQVSEETPNCREEFFEALAQAQAAI